MKQNTSRRSSAKTLTMPSKSEYPTQGSMNAPGYKAILAGVVLTLFGVIAYALTMPYAGEHANILDALGRQGVLGGVSAVLLLSGVSTWLIGNVVALRDLLA